MTARRLPQRLPKALASRANSLLEDRKAHNLFRSLNHLHPSPPGKAPAGSRAFAINLTSNDYLGLSQHPQVIAAAKQAAETWGTGATASRLISGSKTIHQDLERALARFKRQPTALAFPTGFQTNLGVLSALGTLPVTFYSDEYNHASIVDGCRLSRAPKKLFRHRDLHHLERLLAAHRPKEGTPVVVSDSVFSTTGARADLPGLFQLCEQHEALLVVDEAHATGTLGPNGAGLCAATSVPAPVQTATFSKAFGAAGGFVATTQRLADLFINQGRAFIYTTALSPMLAAAANAALAIIQSQEGDALRARLHANADSLAKALQAQGWTVQHESHIVALVLGTPDRALHAAHLLAQRSVFALPFRPPTVPEGLSLLRLAVSAAHDTDNIEQVTRAFDSIRDQFLPTNRLSP